VNLQLPRCEHDETARVAPSGALLWTRGWHLMLIMLHGARKAAPSPPKFKKASPSLTFAHEGSNGTLRATAPRGRQPGASIKTRHRQHECNGLCACAYPPRRTHNALEAEERWPPPRSRSSAFVLNMANERLRGAVGHAPTFARRTLDYACAAVSE
jgi:hypothetical protein